MIYRSAIVNKSEFENFRFAFTSDADPMTGQPINIQYASEAFGKVVDESASLAVFKIAALDAINDEKNPLNQAEIL